jgi:tetratricopeptide (TPR) repeat protein
MRAIALVFCATLCVADEAEVKARAAWAEARIAVEKKDGKAALAKFEEAMKGLPSDPQLLYEAARCAYAQRDLESAENWADAVAHTEDARFKKRPEYQDAVALAAKARKAREAQAVVTKYEKQIALMEEAIRSLGSFDAFVARTFERSTAEDEVLGTIHPLVAAWAQPEVFSGWLLSDKKGKPMGLCGLTIEGIATEEAALAIYERLLAVVEKELPGWEDLVAKFDKERDARIVRKDHAADTWVTYRVSQASAMKPPADGRYESDLCDLCMKAEEIRRRKTGLFVVRVSVGRLPR